MVLTKNTQVKFKFRGVELAFLKKFIFRGEEGAALLI